MERSTRFLVLMVFALVLFSNLAYAIKIDHEVDEKLKTGDEVDVIIKLNYQNLDNLGIFGKKEKIKNSQDSVISEFSENELKVVTDIPL
ncbi:hypothetical protein HYU07_03635 [Candidatus Woesearchaeota archaeon]|nr:hypothetical protein [Candidatus Woesearchaeota archaeon]